jgi:MoaA/NifB/PqqE/SkfB family radical SAM enzyme
MNKADGSARLDDIGFYTLSDRRAMDPKIGMTRLEIILTAACNFNCPYCRTVDSKTLSIDSVRALLAEHRPVNVRFSGGEPTLWPALPMAVEYSRDCGAQRVAISTNGSADRSLYEQLLSAGVDDFSVSLDACCGDTNRKMTGGEDVFDTVVDNIRFLASKTYVTVGVVLTEENENELAAIIHFASRLSVADIRIIPAAQRGTTLPVPDVHPAVLEKHPILRYRIERLRKGLPIRGLGAHDCTKCPLVLDDMAVMNDEHFPCIIYLREGGAAIGKMNGSVRSERRRWYDQHNTHDDPICKSNCIDVCVEYNNQADGSASS